MAHNQYYTFEQSKINGTISMSIQVLDEIIKRTVSEIDMVKLDSSKGIQQIPGTKHVVSCSIKDNEVFISVHVRMRYGVNVNKKTLEIQEKIASAVKDITSIHVSHIDVSVDNIDFD